MKGQIIYLCVAWLIICVWNPSVYIFSVFQVNPTNSTQLIRSGP